MAENVLNRIPRDVARRLPVNAVADSLGVGKPGATASYSGADIRAILSLPITALFAGIRSKGGDAPQFADTQKPLIKEFAELQTISISSTRSISPVRALGMSNALGFTRGARTFAGSMVFATINRDIFREMYVPDISEASLNASLSAFVDQLPPFDIVITASNEVGGLAVQVIRGVTLVNFGTTYSIDDIYTETTYTYVARDVTPLNHGEGLSRANTSIGKSLTDLVNESLNRPYGTKYDYLLEEPAKYRVNDQEAAEGLRRLRDDTTNSSLQTIQWYYKGT